MSSTDQVLQPLQKFVLDSSLVSSASELKKRCDGIFIQWSPSANRMNYLCDAGVRLVACTVLMASKHSLMDYFDLEYCVMDEAGQITQPAAIGALLQTKR